MYVRQLYGCRCLIHYRVIVIILIRKTISNLKKEKVKRMSVFFQFFAVEIKERERDVLRVGKF